MYRKRYFNCAAAAAAAGSGAAGAGAAGAGSAAQGAMAAGSIMNGASGLLGFGLGLASLISNVKANKQARADQMYYYEDQKKWQSPANQMMLRRLAGLNPYGDFQTGSVGQPTPVNLAGGVTEAAGLMANSMSETSQRHIAYLTQKIALKQLELEEKRLSNDTKLADANAELLSDKAVYQKLINWITDQSKESSVKLTSTQVEQAIANIVSTTKANEWFDLTKSAELEKLLSEIASIDYDTKTYKPSMLALQQMLGKSGINLNNAQIEKLAAETGLLKADAAQAEFNSELYEQLNRLGDDLPKGTPKAVAAIVKLVAKLGMIFIASSRK